MRKLLIAAGIIAVAKIGFSTYKKIKEGKKVDEAVVESVKDAVVAVIDKLNDPRTKKNIGEVLIGFGVVGLIFMIDGGNELKALKGE